MVINGLREINLQGKERKGKEGKKHMNMNRIEAQMATRSSKHAHAEWALGM